MFPQGKGMASFLIILVLALQLGFIIPLIFLSYGALKYNAMASEVFDEFNILKDCSDEYAGYVIEFFDS
jgi:hypothetical protein